jgi:hypothetical protein
MTFFSKSRIISRVRQPLVQKLESRQLMSGVTGFDPSHAAPPPLSGEFGHMVRFDQALAAGGPEMGLPPMSGWAVGAPVAGGWAPGGPPAGAIGFEGAFEGGFDGSPDPAWLQAQFAHAIAAGASVTAVVNVPTALATTESTSLSSLYSSLQSSTANQIDAAQTDAIEKLVNTALTGSVADQTRGSFSVAASATGTPATVTAAAMNATAAGLGIHETTAADSVLSSSKALAEAMSVVVPSVKSVDLHHSAAPSWESLRKLEDDLAAVRNMAGAMVAELGRDSAIALSHLEEIVESPAAGGLVRSLSNWRSAAAITGAVIAAVAVAQDETDQKKSVFSGRLIDVDRL